MQDLVRQSMGICAQQKLVRSHSVLYDLPTAVSCCTTVQAHISNADPETGNGIFACAPTNYLRIVSNVCCAVLSRR